MNNNELQRIIVSSKQIMLSSVKQLDEMKKQPHPDQGLMKVIEENYKTAKQNLETVKAMLLSQAQEKSSTLDNKSANEQNVDSTTIGNEGVESE